MKASRRRYRKRSSSVNQVESSGLVMFHGIYVFKNLLGNLIPFTVGRLSHQGMKEMKVPKWDRLHTISRDFKAVLNHCSQKHAGWIRLLSPRLPYNHRTISMQIAWIALICLQKVLFGLVNAWEIISLSVYFLFFSEKQRKLTDLVWRVSLRKRPMGRIIDSTGDNEPGGEKKGEEPERDRWLS